MTVAMLILAAGFAASDTLSDSGAGLRSVAGRGTVVQVIEADLFRVRLRSQTEIVRLVGVSAPQRTPSSSFDLSPQCYALEAVAEARRIVLGKRVRLARDPIVGDRDQVGNRLVYVALSDGTDLGLHLVREGFGSFTTLFASASLGVRCTSMRMSVPYTTAVVYGERARIHRRCSFLQTTEVSASPGSASPVAAEPRVPSR